MTALKTYAKAVVAALVATATANLGLVASGQWTLAHFALAEVAAAATALGVAVTSNTAPA